MNNSIAFLFKSAPHGSSAGREGLDIILTTSSIIKNTKNIGIFFIGDGIFQIVDGQHPNILLHNYINRFKVLPLYDIKIFWVCKSSLYKRYQNININFIIDIEIKTPNKLRKKLEQYDIILTF